MVIDNFSDDHTVPAGRASPASDLSSDTRSSKFDPLDHRHKNYQNNVRRRAADLFMAHYANPLVRANRMFFEEQLNLELLSSSLVFSPAQVEEIIQSIMHQFLTGISLQEPPSLEVRSSPRPPSTMNPGPSPYSSPDAESVASVSVAPLLSCSRFSC